MAHVYLGIVQTAGSPHWQEAEQEDNTQAVSKKGISRLCFQRKSRGRCVQKSWSFSISLLGQMQCALRWSALCVALGSAPQLVVSQVSTFSNRLILLWSLKDKSRKSSLPLPLTLYDTFIIISASEIISLASNIFCTETKSNSKEESKNNICNFLFMKK